MNNDAQNGNAGVWGISVSIPHFLAAIFAMQMKALPAELLLPDISTIYLSQQADSPVHEELSCYLPDDFGETVVSGNLAYPIYPFAPSVFIVTSNNWFILHNFHEVILSRPRFRGVMQRVTEILRFGMDMFAENIAPANIDPVTIPRSALLSEEKILERLHSSEGVTPVAIFESLKTAKYAQLKSWFSQHAATTARYLQFHTLLGSLSITSSLTGGELMSITFTNKHPQNLIFHPFSDKKFSLLVKQLLPEQKNG